jgi:hypothetical protein
MVTRRNDTCASVTKEEITMVERLVRKPFQAHFRGRWRPVVIMAVFVEQNTVTISYGDTKETISLAEALVLWRSRAL